jgi:SapC
MTKPPMPLFYNEVVALDRRAHAKLRARPPDNFSFAAEATLVPLVTAEFAPVAREYPIAFMTDKDNVVVPVALTGMPQSRNLFVDKSGRWDARYIPAYVRRYPFAFVETSEDKYTVCVDPTSKFLDEKEGTPLFDEKGEPTATLQDTIKRLGEYQRVAQFTRTFMKRLADANLLMEASAKADFPDGRSMTWRGFWIVDENRFRALPEATVKEWFASGELGLLYAHLLSLGNLSELLTRHTREVPFPPAAAQA